VTESIEVRRVAKARAPCARILQLLRALADEVRDRLPTRVDRRLELRSRVRHAVGGHADVAGHDSGARLLARGGPTGRRGTLLCRVGVIGARWSRAHARQLIRDLDSRRLLASG